MGFVDNDGERSSAMLAPDLFKNVRKLLHRRDDDLFSTLDEALQITRVFGMADRRAHLKEAFDRFGELVVQHSAVSHDNDRLEDRLVFSFEPQKLVREPCY